MQSTNQSLDLCRFTDSAAEIIELCSADNASADDLDLVNCRAVNREDTLNTDTVCNSANGKGLADAAVLLCNNGTLKNLDTILVCGFIDADVDLDGITDIDLLRMFLHCSTDFPGL